MSGTCLIDDVDFVFSAPVSEESDWLSATKPKPSLRGFYWAFLLSLFVHVLAFQWQPPAYKPDSRPESTKAIHLSLNYAAPPEPVLVPLETVPVEPFAVEAVPFEPVPLEPEVATEAVAEPLPKTLEDSLPEPLDHESLQRVLQQQNRYRDIYLPTTSVGDSVFSVDTPSRETDVGQASPHFNDVFDSRLRARLQNNPARAASEKVSGPTGFTNIHGTTLVELDSGLCMSSSVTAIGQPTNWYITACGGKKSESEQMMERVNRDFRSRR